MAAPPPGRRRLLALENMPRRTRQSRPRESLRSPPPRAAEQLSATGLPRVWITILGAIAAALASVALLVLTLRPSGMAAAMLHSEFRKVDAATRARARSQPTWNTIFADYDRQVSSGREAECRAALATLLDLLDRVRRSAVDPADATKTASQQLERDADNRLSRLVYACIQDQLSLQQANADMAAFDVQRFQAMSDIMDAPPAAADSTLYTTARLRFGALQRHFHRPDVAASIAAAYPRIEVTQHIENLPHLARRISRLADSLNALERPAEATRCRDWFVRTMLELVRNEASAETRLLCADLAVRMLPPDAPAAKALNDFSAAYHRAADAAGEDLCGQANTKGPTPAPDHFHAAIMLLAAAGALSAAAFGGAMALILAVVATPVALLRGGSKPLGPPSPLPTRLHALLLAAAPTALAGAAVLARFHWHLAFSGLWLTAMTVLLIAAGLLTSLALAHATPASTTTSRRRWLIPLALVALFAALALAIHPYHFTRALRMLPYAEVIVLTLAIGLFGTLAIATRPSLRRLARAGLVVWCVNLALAATIYVAHHVADRIYQPVAAAGYLDEVTARLGPDWQQQYLGAAFAAYDMRPAPPPTPNASRKNR